MSSEEESLTIEEFAGLVNRSLRTVKRRWRQIPGITYENGCYSVLEGTRYPFDAHRYVIKDSADRRYVLLKAISEEGYISPMELGVYQKQFDGFLGDLLAGGLIRANGMANTFGANGYDCTPEGDEVLSYEKQRAKREIAELIGIVGGSFSKSVLSK